MRHQTRSWQPCPMTAEKKKPYFTAEYFLYAKQLLFYDISICCNYCKIGVSFDATCVSICVRACFEIPESYNLTYTEHRQWMTFVRSVKCWPNERCIELYLYSWQWMLDLQATDNISCLQFSFHKYSPLKSYSLVNRLQTWRSDWQMLRIECPSHTVLIITCDNIR